MPTAGALSRRRITPATRSPCHGARHDHQLQPQALSSAKPAPKRRLAVDRIDAHVIGQGQGETYQLTTSPGGAAITAPGRPAIALACLAAAARPRALALLGMLFGALLLTGCVSRIIEHPGIRGRFVRAEDGRPLRGVKVLYRNMGDGFTRRTSTDDDGRFAFPADLTWAYTGFPTAPTTEGVELSLRIRCQLNWSHPGYEVSTLDADHAVIEAGDIRISAFFRGEGRLGDLGSSPPCDPP